MELFQTGGNVDPIAQGAINACGNAIKADPELGSGYLRLSRIYGFLAKFQMDNGKNPEDSLSKSIEAADNAVKINSDAEAHIALAGAYRFRSEYELYYGGDPRNSIARMIDNLLTAAKKDPHNPQVFGDLGQAYLIRGEYQIDHGEDPGEALGLSLQYYKKAVEIYPRSYGNFNSMANAYGYRADFELVHGIDPENSLQGAIRGYQKAIELNPKYTHAYNNLGTAFEARGKYEMSTGKDPSASFQEAVRLYRKTIELNPKYQHPYVNLAVTYRYLAEYEIMKGRNAVARIRDALREVDHGLAITQEPFDLVLRAEIHLIKASNDILLYRSPEHSLEEQVQDLEKAQSMDPDSPAIYAGYGAGSLLKASWKRKKGINPNADLEAAERNLNKAIELNPLDSSALTDLAEVNRLKAEIATDDDSAIRHIDQGFTRIEEALKQNPNYARAYAIRALLYRERARRRDDKTSDLTLSEQNLQKALQLNSNLAREFNRNSRK
jgi:Tfp pilus assembly protein PilF